MAKVPFVKMPNKSVQRTANSAAQIAIGFANFNAICTTPFAAFDAGVTCTNHEKYRSHN